MTRRRRPISCAPASRMCRKAAACSRRMSVRDNLLMGAYLRARQGAPSAADLERVYACFPFSPSAQRQDAGTLSGRRAADVRDRPRADGARRSLLLIDELSLGLAPRAVELLIESAARRSTDPASRYCWSSRTS